MIAALIFSTSLFASFFPVGKEGASTFWKRQIDCEQAEGQACYDVSGIIDPSTAVLVDQEVDDKSQPIFGSKYNSSSCKNESDCYEKMHAPEGLKCNSGDLFRIQENWIMPGYTSFCIPIEGYAKVTKKVVTQGP